MDTTETLLAIAAIEIINCLVLYFIISSATNADKRAKYDWAQMELLAKIARVQGVPEEEIAAIVGALK